MNKIINQAEKAQPPDWKAGDIFTADGEYYILHGAFDDYILICLNDGCRWDAPCNRAELNRTIADDFKFVGRDMKITLSP